LDFFFGNETKKVENVTIFIDFITPIGNKIHRDAGKRGPLEIPEVELGAKEERQSPCQLVTPALSPTSRSSNKVSVLRAA
jgi:hypothetical protein